MRLTPLRRATPYAVLAIACIVTPLTAQTDESQAVQNGGVFIPGWTGRIDAQETAAGQVLENARIAMQGDAIEVLTGPVVTYWNPQNRASGDYTVSATFTEPHYLSRNNHPHPYGIVIGGNGLGSDQQRYLYCAAYGNGTFIVRGFGPEPFRLNGARPESHDAVGRASGPGQAVTQQIALSVRGDRIECEINGTVVGSYPRTEALGADKLQSTDGVYGLRFGHNTEVIVTGFGVSPHQH